MIKYVLHDPDAKDNREYVLRDTGVHVPCTLQEATTFDKRRDAANECEGSEEVVAVESTIKYRIRDTAAFGSYTCIQRTHGTDGTTFLYACPKEKATLFDNHAAAEKLVGNRSLTVEPVEVLELVPDTKDESNMGYIVQIGNTDRFIKLVNGERMGVRESQATVFTFKEAALRACTDPDDRVMAVRNHNFKSSTSRWVIYNPQRRAFFGPASCHYYTDQIDEATWFTTEAEAQAKRLTGEVVRRVNIHAEGL